MNPPLVLLFGMPRSGTTWLGKIFDSHPDTLYRHEPDSRGTLNTLPMFPVGSDAEKFRLFLEEYVARLPAIRDEKVSASLPIFAKHYYTAPRMVLRKLLVYGTKAASRFLGSLPVPDVVDVTGRTDVSIVWKSIESMGRLGVLARVFPKARCLLIFRHPCGYVASVLRGEAKHKFESGTSSGEDWGMYRLLLELPAAKTHGLDLAMVKAMLPVERLALRWALHYEHALTETAGLENVFTVRYEDFCEHPQQETKKAFAHCNLPWATETENFIASSTSRENAAYYSVFKDPKVAASKWKQELSAEEIRRIMQVVGQFRASGYYPAEK
ncbi:MAG: sulfotransferase [Proteobacteria bacterium]|nr:sulfotransferase [Pseudomonadota bacterium]